MTLLLSNNTLTRFARSGDYATTANIALEGDLAATAADLLGWLQGQLAQGESISQIMLEDDGQAASAYETQTDEEGKETQVAIAFRPRLSAAVSVNAPLGSRTFAVSSEALPDELRDGLLAAWEAVEALP
jgi:hypothetical protein